MWTILVGIGVLIVGKIYLNLPYKILLFVVGVVAIPTLIFMLNFVDGIIGSKWYYYFLIGIYIGCWSWIAKGFIRCAKEMRLEYDKLNESNSELKKSDELNE